MVRISGKNDIYRQGTSSLKKKPERKIKNDKWNKTNYLPIVSHVQGEEKV